MRILFNDVSTEAHLKDNVRYYHIYDKDNINVEYPIVGMVYEYQKEKKYDMQICDWSWFMGTSQAPNYRGNGYGKELYAFLQYLIGQKPDAAEWRITIGNFEETAISFYEHNFKGKSL